MKSAILASVAVLLALQTGGAAVARARGGATFTIKTLSTRADRVSGGDVLVAVITAGATHDQPRVTLRGRDLSREFHRDGEMFVGLVKGLSIGKNDLVVRVGDLPEKRLTLTNYPITGPIVSGPHQAPFVCQTDTFKLPDGSTLGAPLDPDCHVKTRVQYVYMPKGAKEFAPLTSTTALPADVATTTTVANKQVPFVVRVETGTMNRGIYQNFVLHDPTRDPQPTPFTPPPAWNRRFLALHGVGCPTGWFRQGGMMGVNPLAGANIARLGEGYAIFTNTLNHPTNSCNAFLAGETTMMGKEHAIETFGVPDFTVSVGGSGGAYTSLQIADEFPGLFDGILINATFPDALSIALAGADAHLLAHYFETHAGALTDAQKIAVSGYSGLKAFVDAANQSQRTDPVPGRRDIEGYRSAMWSDAMPKARRYDPATNPRGARPTVFDAASNIYGVDAKTGFARRPFDNVGVQYGLAALKNGTITAAQFLDLNEQIGGFDDDANYVASRSVGNATAITRAYQAGLTLGGGGGLASIPVFDAGAYNDERGYHYQWFHFAIRERIAKENGGSAGNHLMWRGPVQAERAWPVFIEWVANRKRPVGAVDGCWIVKDGNAPVFHPERQTFGSKPDSTCNAAYPSSGNTRLVAGGPLDANTLKCQLKPIDAKDYPASFTAGDRQQLKTIFPTGVCDWSKPGVNQTRVVPWASFGPAPENLIISAPTSNRSQP